MRLCVRCALRVHGRVLLLLCLVRFRLRLDIRDADGSLHTISGGLHHSDGVIQLTLLDVCIGRQRRREFYSVGAERGRAWTEVRRAWSYMRRQGRDCVHQSCAAVPSAFSTVVRLFFPVAGGRRAGSFCPPVLRGARGFRFGGVLPPFFSSSVSVGLLFLVRAGLRRFPHGL